VAAVDLYAVAARLLRAPCARGEGLHHDLDILFRQHLVARCAGTCEGFQLGEQEAVEEVALHRFGYGGAPLRAPRERVVAGVQAALMQLNGEPSTVPVHGVGHASQAGDVLVLRDADLPRLHLADRVHDAAGPGDDQSNAAARLLLVVGHDAVATHAIFLGEIDAHRGDDDAVAQLERTDVAR